MAASAAQVDNLVHQMNIFDWLFETKGEKVWEMQ